MADPLDGDRSIEHLLRQTLHASSTTTPCLDAEQLAAWHAGGLSQSEAVAAERHLAGCSDCQAILAAFVDSEPAGEPAAPATVLPFRQRWRSKWLVSAAAAAAAVLLWVAVPREVSQLPQSATTMARVEEQAASASAPVPGASVPSPEAAGAAATATGPTPRGERSLEPGRSLGQNPSLANVARLEQQVPPADLPVPSSVTERRFVAGATQTPAPAAAVPAASASPASPPPAPPASSREYLSAMGPSPSTANAAERSADVAPAAAASARSAAVGAAAAPAMRPAMDMVAPAEVPAHVQANGSRAVEFAAPTRGATTGEIAARAPLVRWRIEVTGRVARSVAGAAWSAVSLAPAHFITAGSAPTAGVCWLAGRDGVVWRSTNDATFVRVAFPELEAVVAIQAQDESAAMLTLAGGRVFSTTDGGVSWRAVP